MGATCLRRQAGWCGRMRGCELASWLLFSGTQSTWSAYEAVIMELLRDRISPRGTDGTARDRLANRRDWNL